MKKIIAVMAALMFAAVLFNINVSADTTSVDGGITSGGGGRGGSRTEYGNAVSVWLEALEDYTDGNITYDDFNSKTSTILEEYADEFADRAGITLINDIKSEVDEFVLKYGTSTPLYVLDSISDILNSYETTETVSTTDLNGFGCKVVHTNSDGSYYVYYSEYAEIYENGRVNLFNDTVREFYSNKGVLVGTPATSTNGMAFTDYDNCTYYGDVRYSDGTQAPTDDEYVEQPTYDFSNATDSELDELLKQLMEELKRQTPDLSSLEGLLESIYYRLGELDKDDDNALLSDINKSIIALMSSNNANNEELVSALLEIRDELINSDEETEDSGTSDDESGETSDNSHPNHICGTLYNVKPLDKNWLTKLFTDVTELRVEYQGETYYLEECGCLKLSSDGVLGTELGAVDKYYSVDMNYDSYTSIDYDLSSTEITFDNDTYVNVDFGADLKLTKEQEEKVNSIVTLISKLVGQAIPYEAITSLMPLYEGIIFNVTEPKDIILTVDDFEVFNEKIKGFSVTLLSVDFFRSDNVEAIEILRNFLQIVIGYAWLVVMRRKVVSI